MGVKYEVECMACGRKFTLPDILSPVPKHPPKGENVPPGLPYVPCVGSHTTGIPIGPTIR